MSGLGRALQSLILLSPRRVEDNLAKVSAARGSEGLPNLWQLALGVLRMHHRVVFRFETIGMCGDHPVRSSWRARLLQYRPIRFPFLLSERAVAPWDFSGLFSSPERLKSHLLGAHHEKNQFVYDLQIAACYPGCLESIRETCAQIVDGRHPRAEWMRDLTVYEGYHEGLLEAVERAIMNRETLSTEERDDPDITFWAYLDWCGRQPHSLAATWSAWRAGRFTVGAGLAEGSC